MLHSCHSGAAQPSPEPRWRDLSGEISWVPARRFAATGMTEVSESLLVRPPSLQGRVARVSVTGGVLREAQPARHQRSSTARR